MLEQCVKVGGRRTSAEFKLREEKGVPAVFIAPRHPFQIEKSNMLRRDRLLESTAEMLNDTEMTTRLD